jgi:hypothetical protein
VAFIYLRVGYSKYLDWQRPYQETLVETDEKRLREKIHLAEWKIFQRLQQVSAEDDHHEERQAIGNALRALRALKREVLHYPDWDS